MKPASFVDRLRIVAAGRPLTPWLMSLGWTRSDAHRVIHGFTPGPAKLVLLLEKERANLNWLLTGQGEPRLGPAPPAVREAAATYAALTPAKRQLLEALDGMDEKAVKALLEFVRRR